MEKIKVKEVIKKGAKAAVQEFTRLGLAFLPTARGAELPLPPRQGEAKTQKPLKERRENILETL